MRSEESHGSARDGCRSGGEVTASRASHLLLFDTHLVFQKSAQSTLALVLDSHGCKRGRRFLLRRSRTGKLVGQQSAAPPPGCTHEINDLPRVWNSSICVFAGTFLCVKT